VKVAAEKALGVKMGSWRLGTGSLGGVASRWIVSVSASVVFSCTIKSRERRAVMEEADKGCSELCVTVDTGTRVQTAGIRY